MQCEKYEEEPNLHSYWSKLVQCLAFELEASLTTLMMAADQMEVAHQRQIYLLIYEKHPVAREEALKRLLRGIVTRKSLLDILAELPADFLGEHLELLTDNLTRLPIEACRRICCILGKVDSEAAFKVVYTFVHSSDYYNVGIDGLLAFLRNEVLVDCVHRTLDKIFGWPSFPAYVKKYCLYRMAATRADCFEYLFGVFQKEVLQRNCNWAIISTGEWIGEQLMALVSLKNAVACDLFAGAMNNLCEELLASTHGSLIDVLAHMQFSRRLPSNTWC